MKTSIFQMDCLEIQNSHSGAEWREFSSFSNRTFWLERKFSVRKTPEISARFKCYFPETLSWSGKLADFFNFLKSSRLYINPARSTFFSSSSSTWYISYIQLPDNLLKLHLSNKTAKPPQLFMYEKVVQVFCWYASLKYGNMLDLYSYIHVQIIDEEKEFNTCSRLNNTILERNRTSALV